MSAGHVPEFGGAVQDPAAGSTHVGGPRVLTQRQEGGKDLRPAKAVVACMFSQLFLSPRRNLFVLRSKVYR